MPFHSQLDAALQENALTQADFALAIAATQSDVSKILRGARNVGLDMLERILTSLPERYRADLAQSWASEQLASIRRYVRVERADGKENIDPLAGYDEERRAIIEWVMRAVSHPKLYPMLWTLWSNLKGVGLTPEATPRAGKSRTSRRGTRRKTST